VSLTPAFSPGENCESKGQSICHAETRRREEKKKKWNKPMEIEEIACGVVDSSSAPGESPEAK